MLKWDNTTVENKLFLELDLVYYKNSKYCNGKKQVFSPTDIQICVQASRNQVFYQTECTLEIQQCSHKVWK